jgi:hypothetical protein
MVYNRPALGTTTRFIDDASSYEYSTRRAEHYGYGYVG